MDLGNLLTGIEAVDDESTKLTGTKIENLYFKHIFPHLEWNDLLRHRRVCKQAKELTDKYIKTNCEKLCPRITIFEKKTDNDKCLARFLELGFPATSVYIMNTSSTAMFEKESNDLNKFISQFGQKITHVRIFQIGMYPTGNELKLFKGLPNLLYLIVDRFGGGARSHVNAGRNVSLSPQKWPDNFKQLKKVTIGIRPDIPSGNVFVLSRDFMHASLEMEYCADAFSSLTQATYPHLSHTVLGWSFDCIMEWIKVRSENYPEKPNLKYYDFVSYHNCPIANKKLTEFISSLKFLKLVDICGKHSVKLFNVNSAWLQRWRLPIPNGNELVFIGSEPQEPQPLSTPIVSMVNLHGSVIPMTMPNLEKLTIPASSKCTLVPNLWLEDRKPWSALKSLDVTVDSLTLYTTIALHDESNSRSFCMGQDTTTSLIQFLFVGIRRPAVTEVSLTFIEGLQVNAVTVKAASILGACCPNMKKLTLVNWPGTDRNVIKILGDITALSELCLDNCKKIGDLAFIQTDTTDGILKQHSELKKLSLKQLDKMPKFTDKTLEQVISKMEISHLCFTSNVPLTNITSDGIASLKNGVFAKSIEKFPFTGWSLANVKRQDFLDMEKEFRSHDMN